MAAYYNEIDPAAAHILQALIDADVIAPGIVDTRSIKDVQPDDLIGFTQCHFFAGGGLWSVAARLAGWPDDEPLWTGSCPCQPFSAAGKGGGTDDPRHLWPDLYRLIRARRPTVVMGEQVAGAPGYAWFDGVRFDLESQGYASRSVDFPACSLDAPHQRNRQYWITMEHAKSLGWREGQPEPEIFGGWPTPAGADVSGVTLGDAFSKGLEGFCRDGDGSRKPETNRPVATADGSERGISSDASISLLQRQSPTRDQPDVGENEGLHAEFHMAHGSGEPFVSGRPEEARRTQGAHAGEAWPVSRRKSSYLDGRHRNGTYWSDAEWINCHDDKARRTKSGLRFLVNGLPGRVDLWRVGGNAIVPEAAAEVIAAFIDVYGLPSEWRTAA